MPRFAIRLALLSAILPVTLLAQTTKQPAGGSSQADTFASEGIVFERFETTIRMHADGTGEREIHVSMRIQSQGAAQTVWCARFQLRFR